MFFKYFTSKNTNQHRLKMIFISDTSVVSKNTRDSSISMLGFVARSKFFNRYSCKTLKLIKARAI